MLTPFSRQLYKQQLQVDEGFRLRVYKDDEGNWTGGYGHKCVASVDYYSNFSRRDWDAIFELDIDITLKMLGKFKYADLWDALSQPRQIVIANMSYQMGIKGIAGFKKMWSAIAVDDVPDMIKEMRDSKWYRGYTTRAERLITIVESDQI